MDLAGGREAIPRLGGSHVAWTALAGLCRQLAAEFGPHGVRVSWLLSPGSPGCDEHDQRQDGTGPGEAGDATASGETGAAGAPGTAGLLTRHLPSHDEVANIAEPVGPTIELTASERTDVDASAFPAADIRAICATVVEHVVQT